MHYNKYAVLIFVKNDKSRAVILCYYLLFCVIFCNFVSFLILTHMDAVIECAKLARLAGVGAQELGQSCLDHPEQRRFWWGYDLEDGGRLYIEYRRGHG